MSIQESVLKSSRLERAYQLLVNEEDARVCREISEEACRVVPGNFFLQILTQFLTKLGDTIANPKTVLAWLLSALSAPGVFTAFLVPIRESGSLIPQLLIASFVRRQAVRKWTFVIGSVLQALAVFSMALVAAFLTGTAAGFGLIAALIVFSLSRGLCSVASKDVLGKTVPKTRRGRVSGWSEFMAGLVAIGLGIVLLVNSNDGETSAAVWVILLAIAGGLWLLASATYSSIREEPGETDGGGNAATEAIQRLSLLKEDQDFRNFVIARSLLLCSALSAPFFITLAHENTGGALLSLGLFVIADGVAKLVSAPIWGQFADQSSRQVMMAASTASALVGLVLIGLVNFVPLLGGQIWLYPVAFFLLMVSHAGVRMGRKTYVVDLAGGNKRTDYVAVSNTVIGVILLLTGGIGALASLFSTTLVILVLAAMGLTGAWWSSRLPEVT